LKVGSNKNPKGKLYAKFYNAMRTLKNNGLVTTPVVNTIRIQQGIEESRNGNIWTERDFSNKIIFYSYIICILMIVVFSIRR